MTLNINLSEHFKLSEFIHTNVPNGIQSNIDYLRENFEVFLPRLRRLVNVLEKVRSFCGTPVCVTSGLRSPFVNLQVGGVRNSKHQFALASDIAINLKWDLTKIKLYLDGLCDSDYVDYYYINQQKKYIHIQI